MDILHFSHESDLDGKFCHLLSSIVYEDTGLELEQVGVFNCNMQTYIQEYLREYNDTHEKLPSQIIITDLALTADTIKEIYDICSPIISVTYVDHHPSLTDEEIDGLRKDFYAPIIHDTSCSAAKLYSDYLMSIMPADICTTLTNLEWMTTLVSDYDTFKFKENGNYEAEWLNIYFHNNRDDFYEKVKELLTLKKPICTPTIKEAFYDGTIVEFKINDRTAFIENKKQKVRIVNIDGLNVGLVFTDHIEYVSEFGYVVCRELEDKIDLLMIVSPDAPSINIRSCKENATAFAKAHGGGGHPNASGFTSSPEYIKEVFDLYSKYGVKAYLS